MKQLLEAILSSTQFTFLLLSIPRLIVTTLMCGIIGLEREHVNRPAGVRTHVLVGVSSALIMLTSEYLATYYQGIYGVDPSRMGAQIISGIGFLGAGTIIKDGINVRGLTTAASLWAVACIGIAAGAGFYSGAFLATIVIYLTLEVLRKYMLCRSQYRVIVVKTEKLDYVLEKTRDELEKSHIHINHMEVLASHENTTKEIRLHVSLSSGKAMLEVAMENIRSMEEVLNLDVE